MARDIISDLFSRLLFYIDTNKKRASIAQVLFKQLISIGIGHIIKRFFQINEVISSDKFF